MSRKLKILLVDDDRIYQFAARKTIEATGFVDNITIASNGEEALSYLKSISDKDPALLPDVIFLDVNMPVMNGWEFLDTYPAFSKALAREVLIYVVSSSIDDIDIEKSRQYKSVSGYLVKPVLKDKFTQLLSALRLQHVASHN
jgi:CheY-like chemotaxis protein